MTDVNALLRTLGFVECRLEGEEQFSELNGQFKGETTDTLDVILRPNAMELPTSGRGATPSQ
jgi:hypothetical protein